MHNNSSYSTSSLFFKILAWLTLVSCGYVVFNIVVDIMGFVPKERFLKEINMTLQNGIPFFLFLTGAFIKNKKLRIPLVLSFSSFFISYLIIQHDYWSYDNNWNEIDEKGMFTRWLTGISLSILFLTYLFHFFMKKRKTILDILKIVWFSCLVYAFLSVRFPIGFHVLFFFQISVYLFPFLMGFGLYNYFRKPNL